MLEDGPLLNKCGISLSKEIVFGDADSFYSYVLPEMMRVPSPEMVARAV